MCHLLCLYIVGASGTARSRHFAGCHHAHALPGDSVSSPDVRWLSMFTSRWQVHVYIWVNYNELTASSLEIIVSKGNHPQMALIQVSELL